MIRKFSVQRSKHFAPSGEARAEYFSINRRDWDNRKRFPLLLHPKAQTSGNAELGMLNAE
jgi:hypothetical protein